MTGAGNIEVPTKERLKEVILPTLFSDANAISRSDLEYAPANVRYGLEMTAFKETITPPATRYAQGKLEKARFFTSVSSAGFSIGGILVLLGGMLFLWGAQMKKRVAYIKGVALK